MPEFLFTSPEGKKYTVRAPDGATREQAFGVLQQQITATAEPPKPKRQVEGGEGLARGLGETYAKTGQWLAMGAAGGATLLDKFAGAVYGNPNASALQDMAFENLVEPASRAVDYYKIGDGEELTTGGQVGNITGNLAGIIQQAVATGGGTVAKNVIQRLFQGATVAAPSFALPNANERAREMINKGVDQDTVMKAYASNAALDTASGALPVGVAGNIAKRAVSGGAIAAGTGALSRESEAQILGDEYKDLQRKAFSKEETPVEVGIGTALSVLMGGRGAAATNAAIRNRQNQNFSRFNDEADASAMARQDMRADETAQQNYNEFADVLQANGINSAQDPRAAAVISRLFERRNNQQPAPEQTIIADDAGNAFIADDGALAGRNELEARLAGETTPNMQDSLVRAIEAQGDTVGSVADAFTLAATRRNAVDSDLADFDTINQDYQGGLSAATNGTLNGDVRGAMMVGDKQAVIQTDDIGAPVTDDRGRVLVTLTDADGNITEGFVKPNRIKEFNAPANSRLEQDFMARSTDANEGVRFNKKNPPRAGEGVGLGTRAQEKMPLRSTDVISGDKVGGFATRNLGDPYTPDARDPSGSVTVEKAPVQPKGLKQPRQGDTIDNEIINSDTTPQIENKNKQGTDVARVDGEDAVNQVAPENRLPSPDSETVNGQQTGRIRVDSQGRANLENETFEQQQARLERERVDGVVRDYSKNDLGNTAKNVGTTDTSKKPAPVPQEQRLMLAVKSLREAADNVDGAEKAELTAKADKMEAQAAKLKDEPAPQPKTQAVDEAVGKNATTEPAPKNEAVRPLMEQLIKRKGGSVKSKQTDKVIDNVIKLAKQLEQGEDVLPRQFKNLAKSLKDDAEAMRIMDELINEAEGSPQSMQRKQTKSEQAKQNAANRKKVDTKKDDILEALAKIGGAKLKDAISEFGVDKEINYGVNLMRSFHNSDNAMDLDYARLRLDGMGYKVPDMASFEKAIMETLKGNRHLTDEGIEAKTAKEFDERYADSGYDELPEARQSVLDRLMNEYDAMFGRAATDEAAFVIADANRGKSDNFIGEELIRALTEELDNARQSKGTAENIGGARADETATGRTAEDTSSVRQDNQQAEADRPDLTLERETNESIAQRERAVAEREAAVKAAEAKAKADADAKALAEQQRKNANERPLEFGEDNKKVEQAVKSGSEDMFADNNPDVEQVRKNYGGAGTLNAGIPLDKLADFVTDMMKAIYKNADTGEAKVARAMIKDLYDGVIGSGKNAKQRIKTGAEAWQRVARYAFIGEASSLKGMATLRGSKAIQDVVDMFHDFGGTSERKAPVYEEAVRTRVNRNRNLVGQALEPFKNDAPALNRIREMLENRATIKPNTPEGKAAKAIADMLDREYKSQIDAGMDTPKNENFFPHSYLVQKAVKKSADFIKAAKKAYMLDGDNAVDADAKARAFHASMVMRNDGVPESPFFELSDGNKPANDFTKERTFSNKAFLQSGLKEFTEPNLSLTLDAYIRKSAKRLEFENLLGGTIKNKDGTIKTRTAKWDEIAKRLQQEGNQDLNRMVQKTILSMAGQTKAGHTNGRAAVAVVRALTVAQLLRRAAISSLTEPVIAYNRTAVYQGQAKGVANAAKMYGGSLFDLTQHYGMKSLTDAVGLKGLRLSRQEKYRAAELMGLLLNNQVEGNFAASRDGGVSDLDSAGSKTEAAANAIASAATKASFLKGLTNANTVDSGITIGMDMIDQIANDLKANGANAKLAKYEFDRLGVPASDMDGFVNYVTKQPDIDVVIADMYAGNKDAQNYVNAINKFAQQVIQQPKASSKPMLAKHPYAQLAFNLQGWLSEFYYNVQRPAFTQIAKAWSKKENFTLSQRFWMNATPAISAAAMYAIASQVVVAMKDLASGKDKNEEFQEKQKTESVAGVSLETWRKLSQSANLGMADPWVNKITGARYGASPFDTIGGAVVSNTVKFGMAAVNQVSSTNNPETNATERRLAEATYNAFIDPTIATVAAVNPMAKFTVPLSQRDEIKQAFVDATAGKKEEKDTGGSSTRGNTRNTTRNTRGNSRNTRNSRE